MAKFFNLNLRTTKAASPEAQAIKRAQLLVDQAKAGNPAGLISDPSVYDKAVKMLDAFSYDPGVLTKQATLQTEKNALMDKLNNQQTAKNNLKSALDNAQYQLGKNNAASPEVVIQKTAMLYDLYSQQLSKEIDDRRANGQAYDTFIPELQKAQDQAQGFASLSRTTLSNSDPNSLVKQQYGFLVKTDPQTGKIISFALQPLDAANTTPGYIKTNSVYGGVPLYLNGVRDPQNDNNLIAKLGNWTFKGNVKNSNPADVASANGLNQKVLELQGADKRSFGTKFMDVLGGADADNAKAGGINQVNGSYELKGQLKSDLFASPTSDLPKGSVGKDSSGNYYLMNNDGKLFESSDPTVIGNFIGKTPGQIQADAYFLTTKDVQSLKSQQDPSQAGSSILQDPTKNSPINASSTSPTTMNTPPSGADGANQHEAPPQTSQELAGGPDQPVVTTGKPKAIQEASGVEKQQQITEQISKGGSGLFAKAASAIKNLV